MARRRISQLSDLNEGDHICVNGCICTEKNIYEHHLLVVRVVNDTTIQVIHINAQEGVVEDYKNFNPSDITVLDYNSLYHGSEAIARARNKLGQKYHLINYNCEHFVYDVRNEKPQSWQVRDTTFLILLGICLVSTVYLVIKK